MRSYVITGGTDGIGRALADERLARGHQVVVVGRNADKGAAFLAAARQCGAAARAHFVPADLSLVAQNTAAMDHVRAAVPKVDALVLCARHFRTTRLVTADGFENTFAHFYLSRFLFSHDLADLLQAAAEPVVVNVAGPGGTGPICWDDLQLAHGYDGQRALAQGGRLNDLLGAGFADRRPGTRVRYALINPGTVRTGFSGQYAPEVRARVDAIRSAAQPVEDAVGPIAGLLDAPPDARFSAFVRGRPIDTRGPAFDAGQATRLHRLTQELLAR